MASSNQQNPQFIQFRLNEDGTAVSLNNSNQFQILNMAGGGGNAIQLTNAKGVESNSGGQFQVNQLLQIPQQQQQQAQMVQQAAPAQELTKKGQAKKRRKKNDNDGAEANSGPGEKTVQKLINANNESQQMNFNKYDFFGL